MKKKVKPWVNDTAIVTAIVAPILAVGHLDWTCQGPNRPINWLILLGLIGLAICSAAIADPDDPRYIDEEDEG